MGKTARQVMTGGTECVGESDTVVEAARKLALLDVDALPICGDDQRLKGMLTTRDIVRALALEKDSPSMRVRELSGGKPVTIGAGDPVELALKTMVDHNIRRLPVIDGHQLVGVLSMADAMDVVLESKVEASPASSSSGQRRRRRATR